MEAPYKNPIEILKVCEERTTSTAVITGSNKYQESFLWRVAHES